MIDCIQYIQIPFPLSRPYLHWKRHLEKAEFYRVSITGFTISSDGFMHYHTFFLQCQCKQTALVCQYMYHHFVPIELILFNLTMCISLFVFIFHLWFSKHPVVHYFTHNWGFLKFFLHSYVLYNFNISLNRCFAYLFFCSVYIIIYLYGTNFEKRTRLTINVQAYMYVNTHLMIQDYHPM